MEFIEFLQDKWVDIMFITAIVTSLFLCILAFSIVAVDKFKKSDYVDSGYYCLFTAFFVICLVILIL